MAALGRWLDGDMQLPPATAKCLDALLAYATVEEALAAAASRPPPVMMPIVWNDKEDGRAYISLPGDPRHPVRVDALGGTDPAPAAGDRPLPAGQGELIHGHVRRRGDSGGDSFSRCRSKPAIFL